VGGKWAGQQEDNQVRNVLQGRNMPPKIRDLLDLLRHDGWIEIAVRGSHRQFKHPVKRVA
jgi:hypothetical protein